MRITDLNLSATGEIYAGYQSHPAQLFLNMALQWSGWPGVMAWRSLEGELALHCSHNGSGNISIRVEFLSLVSTHSATSPKETIRLPSPKSLLA